MGSNVIGIDENYSSIKEAKRHARERHSDAEFIHTTVKEYLNEREYFDIILLMEVVEHVEDLKTFIYDVRKMLDSKGVIIISSINRTISSYFKTILIEEHLLNLVPNGTHKWSKYVKPSELMKIFCPEYQIYDMKGIAYNFMESIWYYSLKADSN